MLAKLNHFINPYPIKTIVLFIACLLLNHALFGQEVRYRLKAMTISEYDKYRYKTKVKHMLYYSGNRGGELPTTEDASSPFLTDDTYRVLYSKNTINYDSVVVWFFYIKPVKEEYFVQKFDTAGRIVNRKIYNNMSLDGCALPGPPIEGYGISLSDTSIYSADGHLLETTEETAGGTLTRKHYNMAGEIDTEFHYYTITRNPYKEYYFIENNNKVRMMEGKDSIFTISIERDSIYNDVLFHVLKFKDSEPYETRIYYDSACNIIEEDEFSTLFGALRGRKKVHMYDGKGRRIATKIYLDHIDKEWKEDELINYEYDENGLLVSARSMLWDEEMKQWCNDMSAKHINYYVGCTRVDFEYEPIPGK